MNEERDNSLAEIMRRYEKANSQAIIMHDRIAFDSLRDVFHLVGIVEELRAEMEKLRERLP